MAIDKKFRFIKIKDYPSWFLVLPPATSEPPLLSIKMTDKIINKKVMEYVQDTNPAKGLDALKYISAHQIDYEAKALKYNKTLLIRPIGSYMILTKDLEITDETFSEKFPDEDFVDNKLGLVQKYLSKEYNDKHDCLDAEWHNHIVNKHKLNCWVGVNGKIYPCDHYGHRQFAHEFFGKDEAELEKEGYIKFSQGSPQWRRNKITKKQIKAINNLFLDLSEDYNIESELRNFRCMIS